MIVLQRLRLEKDVITRIHRTLRGKGQIRVVVGQQVSPDEIIGTCEVSSGFRTLNVAQALSVAPKDIKMYLKRSLGERIYKGELLAFRSEGILRSKKEVLAPTDGVLDFISSETGEVKLSFLPQKADLPAACFGIIEKVDKARGDVVLRTQVSRIHGVFGTGRTRDGILHILGKRDELTQASKISARNSDQIVVSGSLIYKEAISRAISSGVNGIISGGINAKDFRGMAGGRLTFPRKLENDVGISIVVTEGFGSIPIGEDIYESLTRYNGRFVFVDGNKAIISLPSFESQSLVKVRNTHLPPSEESFQGREISGTTELKKGARVRVVGSSFAGEEGEILNIDKTETLLPSGIKAFFLVVETKRRKISIPANNVEVI